ncbi:MAG: hypothetical protein AB1327_02820, partial [Bacillota bacterium]
GVVTASVLVVAGIILNRMNVVFTGMATASGGSYFPSWMEWSITIGLVSLLIVAYCFIVENFAIFEEDQKTLAELNKAYRYGTAQVST